MNKISVFIILTYFLFSMAANAVESKKYALVIGNSSYQYLKLKNPVNDAKGVGKALNSVGFNVILELNADQRSIEASIDKFEKLLAKNKGVGVFFYAGHGVQTQGENYLIPINANINKEKDLRYNAVNLGRVFDAMESANNEMNIVILDACRNNPFFLSSRSGIRGLARVNRTPKGLLIAYSTSPGKVALDGDETKNSPYSAQLIKSIQIPNRHVLLAFQDIANKVQKMTRGEQVPWTSSSLTQDFYFNEVPSDKLPLVTQSIVDAESISLAKNNASYPVKIAQYSWGAIQDNLKSIEHLGPLMTVIPKGSFMMGNAEIGYLEEQPVHKVTLSKAIAVSRYEVSFTEFDLFSQATGRHKAVSAWGRGNQPIINVSWKDAIAYTQWLSVETGYTYRLPSESEWEYLSRAGSYSRYFWGNDMPQCTGVSFTDIQALRQFKEKKVLQCVTNLAEEIYANCRHCFSWGYLGKTMGVMSYKPNNFGIYNTLGNVAEYTQDCWRENYYGAATERSNDCVDKVVRGGSWDSSFEEVRVTSRTMVNYLDESSKVGIRLVRELDVK